MESCHPTDLRSLGSYLGDTLAVQLKGYPETLSSGAQVLIPDQEANEEILQDFRE